MYTNSRACGRSIPRFSRVLLLTRRNVTNDWITILGLTHWPRILGIFLREIGFVVTCPGSYFFCRLALWSIFRYQTRAQGSVRNLQIFIIRHLVEWRASSSLPRAGVFFRFSFTLFHLSSFNSSHPRHPFRRNICLLQHTASLKREPFFFVSCVCAEQMRLPIPDSFNELFSLPLRSVFLSGVSRL